MLQIVEQRPYIQNIIDFVSSFGITESATIAEMELVEANIKILLERIDSLKTNTKIGIMISGLN
jgi:hypothetical protein